MPTRLTRYRLRCLAPLTWVAISSCGGVGGDGPTTPKTNAPVVTVAVGPTSASIVVGATQQLTASISGSPNTDASWSSSAPAVATVSSSGLVTGMAVGSAQVTATSTADPSKSATATLAIVAPVTVTVTPASTPLLIGQTQQLAATVTGSANTVVTWETSAASVATVSSAGIVTAISAGVATITARSSADPVRIATATITVSAPPVVVVAAVSVSPAATTLNVGATAQFTAITADASGAPLTGRTIQWTSSNPAIARIDLVTGLVTGVAAGSATITATSEGKTGTGTATVTAPVASVTLSPSPASVAVGFSTQVSAAVSDAAGNVLTGRVVAWSSANPSVATVGANTGIVSGVTAGTTTITASVEGKTATVTVTVLSSATGLRAPFATPVATGNYFDHDLPFQFNPAYDNGRFVTFWGELVSGIDGHNGYDFGTPSGTPLLSVAPGVVTSAGLEAAFFCPTLNQTVAGLWVTVRHVMANGDVLYSQYGHLSRIDVVTGQTVAAGQTVGLSGTTGCSTGPHLHFSVFRTVAARSVVTDPFGWTAPTPDPWAAHALGAASTNLWSAGAAPELFTEIFIGPINPGTSDRSPVGITVIRYLGPDDARSPNNEFIELASDARFAGTVHSLSGYRLRNNAGETFSFPAGATISPSQNVRVYSGTGTNTGSTFYWGRSSPAWGNQGDCVRVVYPSGAQWSWYYGNSAGCPTLPGAPLGTILRAGSTSPLRAMDWAPPERRQSPH